MILKQIIKPQAEPITLADVEGQTRISSLSDESSTVDLFITAIREQAEAVTRRALITQQWELVLDKFPLSNARGYLIFTEEAHPPIVLPLPPLQSVDSVKYIDLNGVEQTLDPTLYKVDVDSEPARIVPAYGQSWPIARDEAASVRIRFTCGYGPIAPDTADNVPAAIKQWMLINVANLYENRESETVAPGRLTQVDLSTMADSLIASYRIQRL